MDFVSWLANLELQSHNIEGEALDKDKEKYLIQRMVNLCNPLSYAEQFFAHISDGGRYISTHKYGNQASVIIILNNSAGMKG